MAEPTTTQTSQSFEALLQQQTNLLSELEKQLKELKLTHKKMEKCFNDCPAAKKKETDKETVVVNETSVAAVAKPVRRQAVPRVKKLVEKAVPTESTQ